MMQLEPVWTATESGRLFVLNGNPNAIVASRSNGTKGFMWVYRKRMGYEKTLDAAKDWVETLSEYDSVPGLSYLNAC